MIRAFLLALLLVFAPWSIGGAQAQTTRYIKAADSIKMTDCGGTIVAADGFYQIGTASGTWPDGCRVRVINATPPPPAASAAKFLTGVNCTPTSLTFISGPGTYLWPWPANVIDLEAYGGVLQSAHCPPRWQPAQQITMAWDPTSTSGWGQADGLAGGTRAFPSLNSTLYFIDQQLDMHTSQIMVGCTAGGGSCAGYNDAVPVHWAPQGGMPGVSGGDGVILQCNGVTFTGTPSLEMYFPSTIISPNRCNFANGVGVSDGAKLRDIYGTSSYGAPKGGSVFTLGNGHDSFIWLNAGANITATGTIFSIVANGGGVFAADGPLAFANPVDVTATVVSDMHGDTVIAVPPINPTNVRGPPYWLMEGAGLTGVAAGYVPGQGNGQACPTCSTD